MSTIGKLNTTIQDGDKQIIGHISTLEMRLRFRLVRNQYSSSDNAPDYMIIAANSHGEESQIGSVWIKQSERFGEKPSEFFSMTFDDPSFPHPLNVAAFANDDGSWNIVWRRRQAA